MKREIINSDYEMRLASLRELQSAGEEELSTLMATRLDGVLKSKLYRLFAIQEELSIHSVSLASGQLSAKY